MVEARARRDARTRQGGLYDCHAFFLELPGGDYGRTIPVDRRDKRDLGVAVAVVVVSSLHPRSLASLHEPQGTFRLLHLPPTQSFGAAPDQESQQAV